MSKTYGTKHLQSAVLRAAIAPRKGRPSACINATYHQWRASRCVPQSESRPAHWNAVAGRSIANTRLDDELNARLDTIRARIMQIHRQMELDEAPISASAVLDRYLGRNGQSVVMLLDLFREHNEKCRQLAGNGMAPATVKRYETSLRHTESFIQSQFGKSDIPVKEVNHKFITDYQFYLRTECKCCHNSAVKYLKNFGKIIRIARANEYLTKDPFANIRFKFEETQPDFLEEDEILKLIEKPLPIERMAQVRDVFVFSCFTDVALMRSRLIFN